MKKVKWGVIGCGGIADRRTLPGMMEANNAELIAVMDTNGEAAEKVKEKYGAKYAFSDMNELLAIDEIEAVYIASPVFCHKAQVEAAAKAGKHILLEKPIGIDIAEAEEIIKICDSAKVKLGVGFMMRYAAYHEKMKEIIAEGKIGKLVSARAEFTCWYPTMDNCWRQDAKLSGGGAMMDMGIHCIDLIRYITGAEFTDVAGIVDNQVFEYNGVEDAGYIVSRLSNGAVAYVGANFNIPDEIAKCALEFYGTAGSITATGTLSQIETGSVELVCGNSDAAYDAMQNKTMAEPVKLEVNFGNMYTKEIEGFGKAVLGEGEIPVTAFDALQAQKVVEAAYNSNNNRTHIKL